MSSLSLLPQSLSCLRESGKQGSRVKNWILAPSTPLRASFLSPQIDSPRFQQSTLLCEQTEFLVLNHDIGKEKHRYQP